MTSKNKLDKTDKKKHFGKGGRFLKLKTKLKGTAFYNGAMRRHLKKLLNKSL